MLFFFFFVRLLLFFCISSIVVDDNQEPSRLMCPAVTDEASSCSEGTAVDKTLVLPGVWAWELPRNFLRSSFSLALLIRFCCSRPNRWGRSFSKTIDCATGPPTS